MLLDIKKHFITSKKVEMEVKMKTVAFVPIKLDNQRLPGKNTMRFDDGTSLITVFLKTLVKVKGFDEIYVFCSDTSIKEHLVPGVQFLKRPTYRLSFCQSKNGGDMR